MAISHELTFASQLFEGFSLPLRCIAFDVIEHFGLQHKESSVDPAFLRLWLLGKFDYLVALHFEVTETRGWPDRRQGRQLAVRVMEGEQIV
jgi:hypothetical protein